MKINTIMYDSNGSPLIIKDFGIKMISKPNNNSYYTNKPPPNSSNKLSGMKATMIVGDEYSQKRTIDTTKLTFAKMGSFENMKYVIENFSISDHYEHEMTIDKYVEFLHDYLHHEEYNFADDETGIAFEKLCRIYTRIDEENCRIFYFEDHKMSYLWHSIVEIKREITFGAYDYFSILDILTKKTVMKIQDYARFFYYAPDDNKPFPKYKQSFDEFMKEMENE